MNLAQIFRNCAFFSILTLSFWGSLSSGSSGTEYGPEEKLTFIPRRRLCDMTLSLRQSLRLPPVRSDEELKELARKLPELFKESETLDWPGYRLVFAADGAYLLTADGVLLAQVMSWTPTRPVDLQYVGVVHRNDVYFDLDGYRKLVVALRVGPRDWGRLYGYDEDVGFFFGDIRKTILDQPSDVFPFYYRTKGQQAKLRY